jgi:hypothetical protein
MSVVKNLWLMTQFIAIIFVMYGICFITGADNPFAENEEE